MQYTVPYNRAGVLSTTSVILTEDDGSTRLITIGASNQYADAYAAWLAAGNTPATAPAPAAPPPTSVQIVSTSTPALNGAYAIDPGTQQRAAAVSLYIQVNGRFPSGQTQLPWPDASGAPHLFPTTAEFQAFATALADFVATLDLGQTPTQPITIA